MAGRPLNISELNHEIAKLDRRIEALRAEIQPLRKQISNIDKVQAELAAQKAQLQAELAKRSEQPRVSDHAVIRYLERLHGFDFEKVRAEILTPAVVEAIKAGADGLKVEGGRFKFRDNTVVTFLE